MNEWRNAIIGKEIPENENQNKIIGIVDKIHDFNNQQKGKGLERNASKITNISCTSKIW